MKCKTFAIRALVMLLCVTMLIGMIPVYVSATNSVKIEVGTATIDLAEDVATDGYYTVNIPINITENTGLIWIGLDVTYDPKLDLVDWTEGEVFPYIDGTLDAGLVDYEMSTLNVTSRQAADFEKNPFHVSYQGGTLKANNTKTGTLINLVFKVPDTIGKGEYPISVAVDTILSQEDTDGSDGYDAPVDITSSASATAGKLVAKKNI